MNNENQNIIAEALRSQGIPEDEIARRLMVARMSTSGDYDVMTDSYASDEENAPETALNEPLEPSNLPPLKQHDEVEAEADLEFLQQFELDPTIEDEPIQYCFEICGVR